MSVRACLVLLLTVVPLAFATITHDHWQGTGSMNQSVMAKIFNYFEANVDNAINSIGGKSLPGLPEEISTILNNQWNPAWNVVIISSPVNYDSILYGYAFRDHWMWYNGINNSRNQNYKMTLIVWKDYNCQTYRMIGNFGSGSTTFTTEQKSQIATTISSITKNDLIDDIWGTAHRMMTTLTSLSGFSSPNAAYTIIMSQHFDTGFYGYVCGVGNQFYYSETELTAPLVFDDTRMLGKFYLFQTRSGPA